MLGEQEAAVQAVGPGVVAADQVADLASTVRDQLGAAVAALPGLLTFLLRRRHHCEGAASPRHALPEPSVARRQN